MNLLRCSAACCGEVHEEDMEEWRNWFNKKRHHRGVKDYPANLYRC